MRQFTIQPSYWLYWIFRIPRMMKWINQYSEEFEKDKLAAAQRNRVRFDAAVKFDFPEVEHLEIEVFLESKAVPGYLADCGVSYKLTTEHGSLLMDLGFNHEREGVVHNALKQGFMFDQVDGLIITHNHWDHMGGMQNVKDNTVRVPEEYGSTGNKPCWVAEPTAGENLDMRFIEKPQELAAGICTLGPLSRGLFSLGCTEEQTVIVNVKGKGLVVITGCGHPTIQKIFEMIKLVSDIPVYAVVGGLHLPIKESRITREGIRLQFVIGHGLVPTKRLTDKDLFENIDIIRSNKIKKVLLSTHDTDDYAVDKISEHSGAEVEPLIVGKKYRL